MGSVPLLMQDSIQVHLKGGTGPITVMTSDIGTVEPSGQKNGFFLTLEESRIDTTEQHAGTPDNQRSTWSELKAQGPVWTTSTLVLVHV